MQDTFIKRFDDTITDVSRKLKCVDDTLLHNSSVSDAFWHTYDFLQRCIVSSVTLPPDKFCFCKRSVTFTGYLFDWEEYQPSRDLVSSITDFKMPVQPPLTAVQSWFGFINQVALFIVVAPVMKPFKKLL